MKKLLVLCALFIAFSIAASAQDFPRAEVFGGYSFLHQSDQGIGANFNGGTASLSVNPRPWLGLVADFGGYHRSDTGVDQNEFTYLFGPKLALRSNERFTPFAHALFGVSHSSVQAFGVSASDNAFAMALGGGLDANLNKNWAIRVAQVDYLLTKFNDGGDNRQNGVRVSTGIVYRFGK